METLPPGWIKEKYDVSEAVAIVVWSRYGGPHPASRDRPNPKILRDATADVERITTIGTPDGTEDPEIRTRHQVWSYTVLGRRFSSDGRRIDPEPPRPAPRWVELDKLMTLCFGKFADAERNEIQAKQAAINYAEVPTDSAPKQEKRKRTGTTRRNPVKDAIRAARTALLKKLEREPSGPEVHCYLYSDMKDTNLKFVVEKTINNYLSDIRKEPTP